MSQILVAADGRIVTASEDGTIRIWDGETGKQRLKLTHEHWVRSIAVSPDGKKLVSSSLDDTVCLWDLTTGRKIYKLPGHGNLGGRRAVGFSTDGKSFLSWGDDMYLRKWDVATGKAVSEYKIRPKGVRVPEDEEDRDRMEFLGMREGALTPDCKLFILNGAGQNHVFEATTGNELQTFPTEGSHFTALAMSADSKLMLISEYAKQIQVKQPDGSVLDTYPPNHRVTLYELSSEKTLDRIHLPGESAGQVAFSRDGKLFAEAGYEPDSPIRILDTAKGEQVGVIKGFRGHVHRLAFTPDGKRLISGMSDTSALVWDLAEAVVKEK
jgi:WD40 repeat protein